MPGELPSTSRIAMTPIPEAERRVYGEFDDPVDDRDMIGRGVIWINANHPIIEEKRSKDEGDPVFLEIVANYVLLVVAQYHAQKQVDAEPTAAGPAAP